MATLISSGTLFKHRPAEPLTTAPFVALAIWLVTGMFFPSIGEDGSGILLSANIYIWISASIFIGISLYSTARTRELKLSKIHLPFALACLLLIIPIFFEPSYLRENVYRLLAIIGGVLFLFGLKQVPWTKRHTHHSFLLLFVFLLIKVLWSYLITIMSLENIYPLYESSFTIVALIFPLSAFIIARYSSHKWLTFALCFLPLFITPLYFYINTATAWSSFVLCALFTQPVLFRHLGFERWLHWNFSLLIGFGLGVFIASYRGEFFHELFDHPYYALGHFKNMLIEKFALGYGYGQVNPAYMQHVAYQHYVNPDYPNAAPLYALPLNDWLNNWLEGGFIALWGSLVIILIIGFVVNSDNKSRLLFRLSFFVPFICASLFSTSFYEYNFQWLLFIALLFMLTSTEQYKKPAFHCSIALKKTIFYMAIIIPICSILLMGLSIHSQYLYKNIKNNKFVETTWFHFYPLPWKKRLFIADAEQKLKQGSLNNYQWTQYANWQRHRVKQEPTLENYQLLLTSYKHLGDENAYDKVLSEARYLFPKNISPDMVKE